MNFRRLSIAAVAVFSFTAWAEGAQAPVSVEESSGALTNRCAVVPFSLTAIDASSLASTRTTWNAGSNNGAWHYMEAIEAYITPQCPATPASIQAVVEEIANTNQGFPGVEYGTFTNRAGLSQSVFLSSNYYGNGTAVLAAMDAFAGGGTVQAWLATYEVPCHNCHEFNQWAVLFYPATRKVIVLQGYTGYDS